LELFCNTSLLRIAFVSYVGVLILLRKGIPPAKASSATNKTVSPCAWMMNKRFSPYGWTRTSLANRGSSQCSNEKDSSSGSHCMRSPKLKGPGKMGTDGTFPKLDQEV